ncbi:MAG: hypothetical protein A2048_10370 [Deltaproteobacteria bacterium GWA2_45_12]|nr:MAG: hypothetical protein A2048_10370 [Deltaproteobacteria bacterium GWA2_45_12]
MNLIRKLYAEKLPEKLNSIKEYWNKIVQQTATHEDLNFFYHTIHKLAGSGTTFGMPHISRICLRLQQLLDLSQQKIPNKELNEIVNDLVFELEAQISKPTIKQLAESVSASTRGQIKNSEIFIKKILIVDDDAALATSIALHLTTSGFQTTVLNRLEHLKETIVEVNPDVLIIDLCFPEGRFAGADALSKIKREQSLPFPIICISSDNSLHARRAAFCAGGCVYLYKPPNMLELLEYIYRLTSPETNFSWKILIIDDDEITTQKTSLHLQQEGFQVKILTDPYKTLDVLPEFNPDLLILDLHMPQIQGNELAGIIRQTMVYEALPIIFWSAEENSAKQMEALQNGGEDFLSKTGDLSELVL